MRIYVGIALLSGLLGCSDNSSTSTTLQDSTSKGPDTTMSQPASASISEEKTKQVLDHHWKAFTGNNLEDVMADYTEESVLITPDATYKGLEQIKGNFIEAYKKFPKEKSTFNLSKSVIDRDVAYILWQSKTPTFDLTFGTDTFIIRDGKIIRQTYGGVATALTK